MPQLNKEQYDRAFGEASGTAAVPSTDSEAAAAPAVEAPAGRGPDTLRPEERTGMVIGEVPLQIFYNDGNKVPAGRSTI